MTDSDERALLARINALSVADARDAFFRCCGVEPWAVAMTDARPYARLADLDARADALWRDFTADDWRVAFAHHPRIGELDTLRAKFANTQNWASVEQSGAAAASDATLLTFAAENDAYFDRFGYIFIVCATGKTADEMLALLRDRLPNTPEDELLIAAEEQKKITRLRLRKL